MSCLMETKGPLGPRVRSAVEAAFGHRIREAREAAGLSQAQLADQLVRQGVKLSPSQVAKVERGERSTSIAELTAFARVFCLQPARLVNPSEYTQHERHWIALEAATAELVERERRLNAELRTVHELMLPLEQSRDALLAQEGGGTDGQHSEAP